MKEVQSFFYYMWNKWNIEECKIVFKSPLWEHIWSKWHGSPEQLFKELDSECQKLLVDRALSLYDGRKRREVPGMEYENEFKNALCNALEGGSNYWYLIASSLPAKEEGDERFYHERFWDYLKSGGTIKIMDCEDEDNSWVLTWDKIRTGTALLRDQYPKVWADIRTGADDSSDADVWFQLCVIGDAIYG